MPITEATDPAIRPNLTPAQAEELALDLYGVRARASLLPSEGDQNFRLTRSSGPVLLLKLANADDPHEALDLQNEILAHLANSEVAPIIPRLLPTRSGETMAAVSYGAGGQGMARLLTYLPGRPIAEVAAPSEGLLQQLGAILGTIDSSLASLSHPGADRYLQWDSRHAPRVIAENLTDVVNDHRDLLSGLARTATKRLAPHLPQLRQSIIHNDANDFNVMVMGDGAEVSGLIDFGDAVRSYTVAELANCAAYMMLDKSDPLPVAAHLAVGYHRAYPLGPGERLALFHLIITRLCLSAAIGARQTRQDPDNDYLAISQPPVWALLERLGARDYDTTATRLHELIEQGLKP